MKGLNSSLTGNDGKLGLFYSLYIINILPNGKAFAEYPSSYIKPGGRKMIIYRVNSNPDVL